VVVVDFLKIVSGGISKPHGRTEKGAVKKIDRFIAIVLKL